MQQPDLACALCLLPRGPGCVSAPGMTNRTEQQALSGTEAGIVMQFPPRGTSWWLRIYFQTQRRCRFDLVGGIKTPHATGKLSPHQQLLSPCAAGEAQALQWTACALQLRPVQPNQSINQSMLINITAMTPVVNQSINQY